MSYKVVEEILEHSRAKHGTRLVELAIAETAHHDGVAFLPQAPRVGREGKGESIAERTNLSSRQVKRCIRNSLALDNIEIRSYWKGRVRLYVCRVIVGRLRNLEADHGRLAELGIDLALPFSTPAQLTIPRRERERLTRGQNVTSSEGVDEGTFAPERGDICDLDEVTSAPPHARASEPGTSLDPVRTTSLTSSTSKDEVEDVPAEAAGAESDDLAEELLRAFAEELGAWPQGRREWGAWKKAFGELAGRGVDAEQLRVRCRSYRKRWPEIDLTPFGLTKHWLLIGASLLEGQFSLLRWAYDRSWRLDQDDVEWIIDQAALDPTERDRVKRIAADVRLAHQDEKSEFLRWVERGGGWALSEDEWKAALRERAPIPTELRQQAEELRRECRGALAELQFGAKPSRGEAVA